MSPQRLLQVTMRAAARRESVLSITTTSWVGWESSTLRCPGSCLAFGGHSGRFGTHWRLESFFKLLKCRADSFLCSFEFKVPHSAGRASINKDVL